MESYFFFLKKDFFKFFLSIIKLKLFNPNQDLEKVSAETWANESFGVKFTKKVWEPLIKNKYGRYKSKISALWLATRIKRHLSTKIIYNNKSRLGYLVGTYKFVINKIENLILKKKGKISKNCKVLVLRFNQKSLEKIITSKSIINCKNKTVISTLPLADLKKIKKNKKHYFNYLNNFENCSATILILKTQQRINSDYWVTVSDKKIPFDLIINQNEIWDKYKYNYYYLSRYHEDPKHFQNKDIYKIFCNGIKKMYNDFDKSQIITYKILSSKSAAPIPYLNFSDKLPNFNTAYSNFFHVGFDHIYPEDRGVGNSIKLGKDISKLF